MRGTMSRAGNARRIRKRRERIVEGLRAIPEDLRMAGRCVLRLPEYLRTPFGYPGHPALRARK